MAKPDPAADGNGPVGAPAAPLRDPLFWTRSIPLTARILFVNIFALALFAGSLFYLDSYRNQLLVERFETARSEAEIVSDALVALPDAEARERLIVEIARDQRSRIRTYDPRGRLVADSFDLAEPGYTLGPPDSGNFFKRLPGYLDSATDALLGAQPVPQRDVRIHARPGMREKDAVERQQRDGEGNAVKIADQARAVQGQGVAHPALDRRAPGLKRAGGQGGWQPYGRSDHAASYSGDACAVIPSSPRR